VRALKEDLVRCEKLGAEFLVVHPGAFSETADLTAGLDRIVAALDAGLAAVPGKSKILVENMAGGGRRVGGPFAEVGAILKRVEEQDRIGVCFDTCHAVGAGYDISDKSGVQKTWDEFDREVGLNKIAAFHVNDSKGELGGHRDLHEHLGKGRVGLEGFRHLFAAHDFSGCAFILETPKEPAPQSDLENLKRLRSVLPRVSVA
jgi:deoxyribonuclease-4